MSRHQRRLGYYLAIGGLICIGLLTLGPQPEAVARAAATPLTCILCGDLGGVDFLLNVLLFVPLGLGLALAGFSWRRAVVLAALTTLGVELLQMKLVAGRDASLGDLIANTLGGGLGILIAAYWRQLVFPSAATARRHALAYALLLGWVWAGTAWALGPTSPRGGVWFGQWAPDLSNFNRFVGTPLWLSAGEEPLPPGPALDQARLEDAITARPAIAFSAVLGIPPGRLAPIGAIVDTREGEILLIGQDRKDLAFRVRMRASILKLRMPTVLLRNGMSGQPGDTVVAEGALRDGAFKLRSQIHGVERTRILPLSASWGWSLVTPWTAMLGEGVGALTAAWIAGLVAVLVYWSRLAGGVSVALPPVTILLLLGAIPRAAGFPSVAGGEWVAALAGIVVGLLAARPSLHAMSAQMTFDEYASMAHSGDSMTHRPRIGLRRPHPDHRHPRPLLRFGLHI